MRKFLTLAVLLTACISNAHAQPAVRDSLLKVLPGIKQDSAGALFYVQLGQSMQNTDVPGARVYYQKGIDLAKKINNKSLESRSLMMYGGTYAITGHFDSMLVYESAALTLVRQTKDSSVLSNCLFNVGQAYMYLNDFENAIDYCLQGRAIMERRGYKPTLLEMNDALSQLYNIKSDYRKASEFGEKAISLARELGAQAMLAQAAINLSLSYGQLYKLKEARVLLEEARQIGVDQKDIRIEAYAYMNLSDILLRENNFAGIIKMSEKAMPLLEQIGSEDGQCSVLRGLATAYVQLKNYTKANEYIEKALSISKRLGDRKETAGAKRVLSSIKYATGNPLEGFRLMEASDTAIENMMKDMISDKSVNLEKKYETEKKEIRIKELEAEKKIHELTIRQQHMLNYVLVGGALVLALVSFLLYRNYRQKQRLQQQRITELETEKRLTVTEAVIKGEEQERTRLAQELHDGLGGMLSGIKYSFKTMQGNMIMTPENLQAFERSMDMLDSSIKEMRRVAHNMMPEALVKFGLDTALKDYCNDVSKSGALNVTYLSPGMEGTVIEQTTAITIYRIVQELLNNIVKHAGARNAIVQVMRTDGQLAVTVEDDGKGFDSSILGQARGIGWSNIRNRVEFLKGQLNLQSENGKGTSVHIELPI